MGNSSNKRTRSRYKQIFFAVIALIVVIVGAKIIFFSDSEPESKELIYSGEFVNEKNVFSQFWRVFARMLSHHSHSSHILTLITLLRKF